MSELLTRRRVLAGACGTCAVAVTGCATYGAAPQSSAPTASAAPPPATSGPAGSGSAAPAQSGLAATADIPVGGGVIFADQDLVITQPVAGEFKAFSATCTHQGCAVTTVRDGTINCPCHSSFFAIADGSVTGGPAARPLPERAITVSDGSIDLA